MKHTPRPWEQLGTIIYSPENGVICELSEPYPEDGIIAHKKVDLGSPAWREAMNNGKLILAAPDLLAACEAIHEWCGTGDAAQALPFEPPWYQQLRAAIAKAKGDSE